MKICILTDNVFKLGGIERVVTIIANEFAKEGKTVDIWCCERTKIKENRELYGLNDKVSYKDIGYFDNRKLSTKVFSFFVRTINCKTNFFNKKKYIKQLTKAYYGKEVEERFINSLNKENYDIIIGTNHRYSMLLGIISDRIKAKTVGWEHGTYDAFLNSKGEFVWHQDKMFKNHMANLNKIVVLTSLDREKYMKNLKLNTEVISNPLTFRTKIKANLNSKNILFIGRLDFDKRPQLAIEAFKELVHKYKEWNLIFVGEGPYKEMLENRIKELNLSNNIILKPKTNKVVDYYLNSSILINTSKWESFSLVTLEAMECGVPVIAFDNQGPREIIKENWKNGVLVSNGDLEELENSLKILMESYEKRKEIAENAQKRVKDFYKENIIEKWNKLLSEI